MNHQRWVSQLEALVKKNFLLTIRRPALSIAAMIAPAIMVGFIVLAYQSTPSAGGKTVSGVMALLFNQTVPLKLPTCEDSCSKIFFSPNDSYHSGIMERFVLITGMDLARDVESFQSDVDMASAIINRYNLLKGFQFFAGISWTTNQTTAPNATAYTIWTDGPKYGKEFTCDDAFIDASSSFPKFKPYALSFQSQIEAAIVSYLSDPFSNTSANFSVKLNWFQPSRFASNDEDIDGISLTYRPESYCNPASSPDLVSPLVRVLLALGYIPLFTLSMSNISNEKQKRLLYPLRR
ncbi:hypothetical protein BJ742DRAFT_794437 [Cladochytrium replicatum]|nr:hypothetical protein BJ742DRAFT_794437 [Cladochytrium replicatum]